MALAWISDDIPCASVDCTLDCHPTPATLQINSFGLEVQMHRVDASFVTIITQVRHFPLGHLSIEELVGVPHVLDLVCVHNGMRTHGFLHQDRMPTALLSLIQSNGDTAECIGALTPMVADQLPLCCGDHERFSELDFWPLLRRPPIRRHASA